MQNKKVCLDGSVATFTEILVRWKLHQTKHVQTYSNYLLVEILQWFQQQINPIDIGLLNYAGENLNIFVTTFAEYKRIWNLKEDLVVNVKAKEARAIIISWK